MNAIHTILSAALCFGTASANAIIIDIDAKSSTPVSVYIPAGDYHATVMAGKYSGYSLNLESGVMEATGFRPTYVDFYQTFDVYDPSFSGYTRYATTAQALQAFATGPYVAYDGLTTDTPIDVYTDLGFTLYASSYVDFTLPVTDHDSAIGGVSIDLEPIAQAVPEPTTLALMAGGLALVGWSARRRG